MRELRTNEALTVTGGIDPFNPTVHDYQDAIEVMNMGGITIVTFGEGSSSVSLIYGLDGNWSVSGSSGHFSSTYDEDGNWEVGLDLGDGWSINGSGGDTPSEDYEFTIDFTTPLR